MREPNYIGIDFNDSNFNSVLLAAVENSFHSDSASTYEVKNFIAMIHEDLPQETISAIKDIVNKYKRRADAWKLIDLGGK